MPDITRLFFEKPFNPDWIRPILNDAYRMDETVCVKQLLESINFTPIIERAVSQLAEKLVIAVREQEKEQGGIEAFIMHYDLSTEEGILLMCLAEALLRVPDKQTENLLIRDKLTSAEWNKYMGASKSAFVNFAAWGLALSGKILQKEKDGQFKTIWHNLIRKTGEPVIRKVVRETMKLMSEHFVLGRTIKEAIKRSRTNLKENFRYSYDMLGEVARTQNDADRYYDSYYHAISVLGKSHTTYNIYEAPSISVKLSALYPRYNFTKCELAVSFLIKRVKELALHAKAQKISMTIDAEEADRLDMCLNIFKGLFTENAFSGWEGLGLAVQAYQKRALPLIEWLIELSRQQKRRIPVRLVKGAYWDSEIKLTQMEGLINYPVFTRKVNTDISYIACAKRMLSAQDALFPQFATHNAYSVATILVLMNHRYKDYQFEFQNLQGMGKALHHYIVTKLNLPCRIYAPVGCHEDLLPYLVRRLLENGTNNSFVNRIANKTVPISHLIESPMKKIELFEKIPNPKIPLPRNLFNKERLNSIGRDLSNYAELKSLAESIYNALEKTWEASPFLREIKNGKAVFNPANNQHQIGVIELANKSEVEQAVKVGSSAFPTWDQKGVVARSNILRKMADLLEKNQAELVALIVREGGRTLQNALSEVREAVDFCYYYVEQAKKQLIDKVLPSYTGESNILRMNGRGIILCISPWNFPVAIFTGQIAAALITGNAVIAKPSGQTPLTAAKVTRLFHEAGVPTEILQLVPGSGETIGQALIENLKISGIIFTGSNSTAHHIQKTLANRSGPIIPFVAETSGINSMIADSTALPEQLVQDVIVSAFDSAGQRCSALRILYIQDDVADNVIKMLAGAMAEIKVGDPMLLATDVGPVIDAKSQAALQEYTTFMKKEAKLIYEVDLPSATVLGTFIAPQAYELPNLSLIKGEIFGPILHVLRYHRQDLDKVIDDINSLGYGLTFGIQSRINETVDYIQRRINAGNIYVNRNIIGAVVGVQPFGGSWLSGTGPKAGGPHYLPRYCIERTLTINTTAAGGNAALMTMED
ncbi:bifunctional proline dehydrogenase/L-glutamate gamma-semialdehyde dehydrogenase PutA [Coxiella endosymbiont of Dermacentor marginatus]|uniref:bifunctional proline dehydrogenase/L-glutamate gamma-semialdehyde dehydrogenase PutA n=1 Tax=Coxiella endosymbiont of Dermacentor marginatus TaxID=1656159 RepID=UPI0022235CB8|nr:bifunctional proline dehydrogenase/L-glutamate gamma-semialdehyde dehydrogenase PutA [Coxiella endosymbiont of Dermacentor marginatus]